MSGSARAEAPQAAALGDGDLDALRRAIEIRLEALSPPADRAPAALTGAVRYSLLAPGKRVRPILAGLSALHFGGDPRVVLDFGCALEMVHAASLILDDLPCMDDAALRRGLPACHVAHGEDVAVLAAVALLNHAFGVVAQTKALPAQTRLDLITTLSEAVGFEGLTAGQVRDLHEDDAHRTVAGLHRLNHQKTAALFTAAVSGGALSAGADADQTAAAEVFARKLGLAFQLLDDVLDAVSTPQALGKDVGQDADKQTFVSLMGVEAVRALIGETLEEAFAALGAGRAERDGASRLETYVRALFAATGAAPATGTAA